MLRFAILALLHEQDDYGYHLKQRFDGRTGGAWLLNIGQVYQTLQALERSGLIIAVAARATLRPSRRRIFAITAKGIRALERWRRRPAVPHRPVRDELLLRLLAAAPGCQRDLLTQVVAQERM